MGSKSDPNNTTERRNALVSNMPAKKNDTNGIVLPYRDSADYNGNSLDFDTRNVMEQYFNHDFSTVRVYTDSRAAESARLLNSNAFTVGKSIVFGANQYSPGSQKGQALIAHELTHVVQQSSQSAVQSKKVITDTYNDVYEQQADHVAASFVNHSCCPSISQVNQVRLQRQPVSLIPDKQDEKIFNPIPENPAPKNPFSDLKLSGEQKRDNSGVSVKLELPLSLLGLTGSPYDKITLWGKYNHKTAKTLPPDIMPKDSSNLNFGFKFKF